MKNKKMKIRKIKNKIIVTNTLSTSIAMFIIIASFFLFFIERELELEVKELTPIARSTVRHLQDYSWDELQEEYSGYYFADKEYMSVMVRENGKNLKLTDDFDEDRFKVNHYAFVENRLVYTKMMTDANGRDYYFSRNFNFSNFSELFFILFSLFLLITFTQFIISTLIAKNIINPVSEIIKQAKEIQDHHIEVKLIKIRDDEIGDLVDIVNKSFEKKEEIIKSQKKFSSDISHELKTPLAIMKGYLDILKWGYEDRKLLLESLADMNEEIVKMENIINSLFLSSNMEKLKLDIKEIEIKNFLEKIKKDYELINKNQEITVDVKDDTTIKGDRNLLFEAFRGIIDNGIKYSGSRRINLIAETLSSDDGSKKSRIII